MKKNTNNIVVILRSCRDPKVPSTPSVSGFGVREQGLRYVMNPSDRSALEFALGVGRKNGVNTIVVSYGRDCSENLLREALAMGADKALLVKEFIADGCDTMVEAKMLSRLVELLDCGLVCTGTNLLDRGAEMAPAVAAALQGWCCVHSVIEADVGRETASVIRKSDRGGRQEVMVPLPAFLLFEDTKEVTYPRVEQLLNALDATIENWTLNDLGLSLSHRSVFSAYTRTAGTSVSRPRPIAVTTPDPELPAFERILSLLEGGIKTREGKLRFLTAKETAERILSAVQTDDKSRETV